MMKRMNQSLLVPVKRMRRCQHWKELRKMLHVWKKLIELENVIDSLFLCDRVINPFSEFMFKIYLISIRICTPMHWFSCYLYDGILFK